MINKTARLLATAALLASPPAAAQTGSSGQGQGQGQTQGGQPMTPPPALATAPQGTLTPVVGRYVRDPEGNDVGRVWDVLLDAQGIPHAAVIDYGGVLGIGKRKVAVAWSALKFGMTNSSDDVTLAMTREQMGAIPTFQYGGGDATVGTAGPSR